MGSWYKKRWLKQAKTAILNDFVAQAQHARQYNEREFSDGIAPSQ
jgi:hypothetical protein